MAATYYVTQSGAGSANGSTLGNAWSVTSFNTAGNWSGTPGTSGKISPGDTVTLSGTITSQLDVQGSGTAGNVITLLFDTGAKLSAAAWTSGGAIRISSKNYITVDGGTNGLIENTANGTALANHVDSYGVCALSASNLTIQNLAVSNMYVRTRGTELFGYGVCVSNLSTVSAITNFTVTNCTFHDAYIGIDSDYGSANSGYVFSYNTVYNCNWCGRCGDRDSGSHMDGLSVHHNNFYNWTNWDETNADSFHHNGFYAWAESGGTLTNFSFYSNTVGPGYGNQYQTGGLFCSGNVGNITVYNNLFKANATEYASNGLIVIGQNNGYSGVAIYNNTFIGGGVGNAIGIGSGNGTYTVKNNIGTGCTFISCNNAASSTLVADYNLGYNLVSGQEYSKSATGSSSFLSFSGWQLAGFDSHGLSSNPLLDGSYALTVGSPAIGAGVDLSGTFTTDFSGVTRSAPWDMGAYKYGSAAPAFTFRKLKRRAKVF